MITETTIDYQNVLSIMIASVSQMISHYFYCFYYSTRNNDKSTEIREMVLDMVTTGMEWLAD